MKKTIILSLILIIFSLFVKVPKYVELNNLIIVDSIYMKCDNNKYIVTLKEIIPSRDDNGIEYEYKKYTESGSDLKNIIKKIEKHEKKKVFLTKSKTINKCKKTS